MSEYICKEDFLEYIDNTICKGCKEDGKDANGIVCRACQIMDMLGYVDDFPVADVEPVVHAKWINHGSFVECSNCHEHQYGVDNFRFYCANCGAKMDLE